MGAADDSYLGPSTQEHDIAHYPSQGHVPEPAYPMLDHEAMWRPAPLSQMEQLIRAVQIQSSSKISWGICIDFTSVQLLPLFNIDPKDIS